MTAEKTPPQPSCIYCGKPVEGVSGGPGTYMHGACVEARRGAQSARGEEVPHRMTDAEANVRERLREEKTP